MHVTVAICTWNRAKLLDATLTQMRQLRIPAGVTWELLVVNNNCSDETDEVLARHVTALPLKRLFEARQGHCPARNCAIAATTGDILVWTDDDVMVDPEWLAEYVAAFERWPEAGVLGGAVDPWLEEEPPAWFRRHWDQIKGLFVVRELYESAFPAPKEWTAVGANMAARGRIAKAYPFDERLGRVGATLSGGDDCEWLKRMQEDGFQFGWVGTARVRHFIPKERLTEQFLKKWFEGAGRTSLRMGGDDLGPRLFGVARWMWLPYFRAQLLEWLYRPFRSERWLAALRRTATLRGMMRETSEQAARQRPTPGCNVRLTGNRA